MNEMNLNETWIVNSSHIAVMSSLILSIVHILYVYNVTIYKQER